MDLINLKNRSYPWDVRHTRWEQSRGGFELKKVLLDIRHMAFETSHLENHLERHWESHVNISHLDCELNESENRHSISF